MKRVLRAGPYLKKHLHSLKGERKLRSIILQRETTKRTIKRIANSLISNVSGLELAFYKSQGAEWMLPVSPVVSLRFGAFFLVWPRARLSLEHTENCGEGNRRNEFDSRVAWLADWHNYAEYNLLKMAQRNKLNRKACARLCRAFFGANLKEHSLCRSIYYCC